MPTQTISSRSKEYNRIEKLSEFDLQYHELAEEFSQIADLAATIAGTDSSFLNLIDNYNQWSISANELRNIPREDSICSVTLKSDDHLEVHGLHLDERFMMKEYVNREDGYRYYFGIPLQLETGEKIGALCVLDRGDKTISEKQRKFLKLLAEEIVLKLEMKKKIHDLEFSLIQAIKSRNQVAHDVRGPIFGISGLAETLRNDVVTEEEMREYLDMISKSANGIIELTDDILNREIQNALLESHLLNLSQFRQKIVELYNLPAGAKNISFKVVINQDKADLTFSRRKLLSIAGNLISNAIKFTPEDGSINVELNIEERDKKRFLVISVQDTGTGISEETLERMEDEELRFSKGTKGEKGFGLGLTLVKEMVSERDGEFRISSELGAGTTIQVEIPIK